MKRLAIKKLIVISQSESRSLEVPFENGLNIILGGNKTGKSSIIKSIFTTLGCECKRIETDWKKLISAYLLFFKYGEKQFCVVRQGKKFQIFENNEDSYSCIIETETFHEYSNCLMDILEIKMPCISKDGKQFNVTPPLLFRFSEPQPQVKVYRVKGSLKNSKKMGGLRGLYLHYCYKLGILPKGRKQNYARHIQRGLLLYLW